MSAPTIVVGGGIAGITCAALAARDGEVVLVEGGDRLGGLLSSKEGPDNSWFDHGTHVPRETGCDPLDRMLFSSMEPPAWRQLPYQRSGHYLRGRLEPSMFPRLEHFPDQYARMTLELLDAALGPAAGNEPATADVALTQQFGPTVTNELFAPMMRKIYGRELDDLAPDAHLFLLGRVVAFSEAAARRLKEIPELDAVLAFHSITEGMSTRRSWYPSTGGCGRWVDDLREGLLGDVTIRLNTTVVDIERRGRSATAVKFADGARLEVDRILWTTPSIAFLRALGVPAPEGIAPPRFLRTDLHHFIFDRPFSTDLDYLTSYDPQIDIFRVTFYPNLRGNGQEPPYSCTVEVMGPPENFASAGSVGRDSAHSTVVGMGVVDPSAAVEWASSASLAASFPLPTPSFRRDMRVLADLANSSLENGRVLGRATGQSFFMIDVLRDCYEALSGPSA